MPRVLVLCADGFEEIETVTVADVLRRAAVEVTLVTVAGPLVEGAHGLAVRSDASLATARHRRWDAVAVPGGERAAAALRESPGVRKLLAAHAGAGGIVAALCAGSTVVAASGIARGRALATYPGLEAMLVEAGARVATQAVCEDGSFLTARGPADAIAFALALVRRLAGERTAAEVARGLLAG